MQCGAMQCSSQAGRQVCMHVFSLYTSVTPSLPIFPLPLSVYPPPPPCCTSFSLSFTHKCTHSIAHSLSYMHIYERVCRVLFHQYMCVCIYIYTIGVYMYIYIYMYICVCIYVLYMHAHTHTHTHTHNTHRHAYIYVYIYIIEQDRSHSAPWSLRRIQRVRWGRISKSPNIN